MKIQWQITITARSAIARNCRAAIAQPMARGPRLRDGLKTFTGSLSASVGWPIASDLRTGNPQREMSWDGVADNRCRVLLFSREQSLNGLVLIVMDIGDGSPDKVGKRKHQMDRLSGRSLSGIALSINGAVTWISTPPSVSSTLSVPPIPCTRFCIPIMPTLKCSEPFPPEVSW